MRKTTTMAYWLTKTDPLDYAIDDFKRDRVTAWTGVRNYQARNYLCKMKKGDEVLIYHSVVEPIGIMGLAAVVKEAHPDPTQFDRHSKYFDPKSTLPKPRWFCPDFKFVKKLNKPLLLESLRGVPALSKMELLRRGSRLSVQPVTDQEYSVIMALACRATIQR